MVILFSMDGVRPDAIEQSNTPTLDRLKREGVGHVVSLPLCTFSDEQRFFSYRRTTHRGERDYGRQISAIALNQD